MAQFSNIKPLLNPSSLRFDEEDINRQKNCVPGPKVQFIKKGIPFSEYISNMLKPGSLGCNSDQYPKYTNGKYCCESEMATPQEQFDYVNMLLLSAIDNVGETCFRKYSREIDYLNSARNNLLEKYRENNLKDILIEEFPININGEEYKDLDDYISKNINISNIYYGDTTHKDRRQGRDSDIETNSNTIINENRDRPVAIPLNMKKSEYYNSINKKEGGKRRFCKSCRKTIKRRKSRKIRTNKKSKKNKRYTKK